MSTNTNKLTISGFAEMARSVQTYVSGQMENIPFTGLSDTPSDFTAGKYLRVNDAGDALEYVDITDASSGGSGGGYIYATFNGQTGGVSTKSSNWDTYVDSITFPQGSWNGYLRINYKNIFTTIPAVLGTADHVGWPGDDVFVQLQDQNVNGCDITIGSHDNTMILAGFNVVIFSDEIAGGSTDFASLTDTPVDYVGHSGDYLVVNGSESGIHFTGIEKIASDLIDYGFDGGGGSTNFTGLQGTPTGYIGHSGQYLIVNNNETGVHFTGIEKIASDLTDYGFSGSLNIPKYTTLPDATNNDNKIVASGCDLYYSCSGEWKKLQDSTSTESELLPENAGIPGCVSTITELSLYQEYREKFVADNMHNVFDQMLNFNTNVADLVHNVCLFSSHPQGEVIIDETTYQWGLFSDTTTVNITATTGTASDGEIQFSHWTGDGAVFADANSSQTTLVVDKDLSITGYFIETDKNTYTCPAVALHVQSDTTNGSFIFTDLSANNTVIPSSVSVDGLTRTPSHTTDQPYLGATSIDFTDNGTRLEVGDLDTKANFQFLHDRTSIYTIEGWMYRNNDSGSSDTILSNAAYTANIGIRLAFLSENNLAFTICNDGSKSFEATTANAIPKNTWVHYAICWDGANITCYINGSSSAGFTQAWTNSVSTSEPSQILWIGARESSSQDRFDGYMQDIRISKRVVYSGDFTPPTSLLGNLCDEDSVDSDGDGVADNSDYFYNDANYTQTKSDLDAYVDDQYRAPIVGDIIKWIFSDEGVFTTGEYYILSSVTGAISARYQGSDYALNEGFRQVKWIIVNPSDEITPDPNRNSYTCAEAALHIQSDTVNNNLTHTDLTGNNTVTASSASSPANTTDQPYLGATSIDFTDNGTRLEVGDLNTKANFQFLHDRTSLYTIEGWMYRNDDSNSDDTIFSNAAFTVDVGIRVRFASGDKLGFTICRGSTSKSFEATTANAIPKNTWVHYTICWDGANITCYINGSSSAGFTQAWTNPVSTSEPSQILWIGARDGGGGDRFDGYMQDIRISKKVVYSGDFTPPTSLLGSPCP